ncbi:DnaJ-domain-containing protein [Auricularia subglabra TFB-10046 SS5]|nr:DnaJ-domain-containing protein [Auricularia subglabra TFB-10046 SS5]
MSHADADTPNPYELLGIEPDATEQQIKTAYRQRSLKVHPDRHPDNPEAAAKFHELNQAYNLLLDPARKTALDESLRVQRARKERFKAFDAKRRHLAQDLEDRERAFKKARLDKFEEDRKREQEIERVKEENRRALRERAEQLAKQDAEEKAQLKAQSQPQQEEGGLGPLDTTVRLKFARDAHPDLATPAALASHLSQFGTLDTPVVSLKPAKKKHPDGPMNVTAVVHFSRIEDAHAAVSASKSAAKGLADVEVSWAAGAEPEALSKLKEQWKHPKPAPAAPPVASAEDDDILQRARAFGRGPAAASSFPSFETPVSEPAQLQGSGGLDFESVTLLRMREMERARLEQQIREEEAVQGA